MRQTRKTQPTGPAYRSARATIGAAAAALALGIALTLTQPRVAVAAGIPAIDAAPDTAVAIDRPTGRFLKQPARFPDPR